MALFVSMPMSAKTPSAAFLPVASVWGFAPLFALAAFAYFLIARVMRQTVA